MWFPRSGYFGRGLFHPHLHCVVPGGGPSPDGQRWVSCRRRTSSCPCGFCPVCSGVCFWNPCKKHSIPTNCSSSRRVGTASEGRLAFVRCLDQAKASEWVVYAKRPFAGPQQVLDYVGRYTHRVALSNNRLLDIENDQVVSSGRTIGMATRSQTMTLSAEEFIRRFLLHVCRTDSNGFATMASWEIAIGKRNSTNAAACSACSRPAAPRTAAEQDYRDRYEELTGCSLRQCPQCQRGRMVLVAILPKSPDHSAVNIDSS